ncbi:hypothetical protein EGT74_16785 [Chitinophaga lutea]|uniref:Uncharacterized protein n=1 Tax=Chitinophaga lutea TaxID=2488634 RepID=A0A3N4PJ45_9BACT|nr:hypothetical protein EGT74_16785 [Chitinophaga lutea]
MAPEYPVEGRGIPPASNFKRRHRRQPANKTDKNAKKALVYRGRDVEIYAVPWEGTPILTKISP